MILFPEALSSFSANTQTHLLYLLPSLPVFIFSSCVFAMATILSFSQLHTFSPLIKRKHPCNRTTKWCVLKDMESDMYTRKPFCFHRWPPYMSNTLSIINFSFFRLLLQFFSVIALWPRSPCCGKVTVLCIPRIPCCHSVDIPSWQL